MHESSGRDVMVSKIIYARSICMNDIAPSCTGTLPSICIDSASESVEIVRRAVFTEEICQSVMSNSEAYTAQKSTVAVASLEPVLTIIALERPYSDDLTANILPGTQIHLRSMATFSSPLDILHSSGRPLGAPEALCSRVYRKVAFRKCPWDILGDAHEKLGEDARASYTFHGAAVKGHHNCETSSHRGCI